MPFLGIRFGNPAGTFRRRSQRTLDPLLSTLRGQAQGAISDADSPQSSALFQSGQGAIFESLRRQAGSDASSAAARGLTGSGFEIAQGASRNNSLVRALRGLLGQSSQLLEGRRRSSIGQLLQGSGLQLGADQASLGASQAQLQMILESLREGAGSAALAFGGG